MTGPRTSRRWDTFAQGGGQLVLLDRGVELLDDLGVVTAEDIVLHRTRAGHVDFPDETADDPYRDGLVGFVSQTYFEVMLGFPPDSFSGDSGNFWAPNWGVEQGAWEAAGGETVATISRDTADDFPTARPGDPSTALGRVDRGEGQVVVFGSILPQAVETIDRDGDGENDRDLPHPFGLADFAPTIGGGQVLDNILAFDRDGAEPEPVVPEAPVAVLLPLTAVALGAGTVLVRRRREQTA